MKEVIKNKTKKIWIIILIILLPIFIYLLIDWKNLYVDIYNFWQLNKAKPILESIDKDTKKFYSLKEFNEIYNTDIEPIKNCYDITSFNWKYQYIFWFKLESKILNLIYSKWYYVSPWYDKDVMLMCAWTMIWPPKVEWWCPDRVIRDFIETITNPCKD